MKKFNKIVVDKIPKVLIPFTNYLMWNPSLLTVIEDNAWKNFQNAKSKSETTHSENLEFNEKNINKKLYYENCNYYLIVLKWFFMPFSKKFISYEGTDGVGKETQSVMLKNFFNSLNIDFTRMEIPNYGLPHGKLLKKYLNGNSEFGTKPRVINSIEDVIDIARVYALNRFEALNTSNIDTSFETDGNQFLKYCYGNENFQRITDSLKNGIIMDRWVDSSIAFSTVQLRKLHVNNNTPQEERIEQEKILKDYIKYLEYETFKLKKPDYVVLLIENPDLLKHRLKIRAKANKVPTDKYEKDIFIQQNIQNEYLTLSIDNPNYIIVGDLSNSQQHKPLSLSISDYHVGTLLSLIEREYLDFAEIRNTNKISYQEYFETDAYAYLKGFKDLIEDPENQNIKHDVMYTKNMKQNLKQLHNFRIECTTIQQFDNILETYQLFIDEFKTQLQQDIKSKCYASIKNNGYVRFGIFGVDEHK